MFTTFLTATALASILVLVGLLLRPRRDEPLSLPYSGLAVAAVTVGLLALGLWMV